MRHVLTWLAVLALCCASRALAGEVPPDARLEEAQRAYDAAKELDAAGKYAEALNQGKQALALREAMLGGSHLDVASCLDLLGTVHRHERNYALAEPLIRRGLALREAALGD